MLCALLASLACSPSPEDPLASDLRRRVEELKVAAAAEPTSPADVFDRNDVMWDWANAVAVAGVAIPVNLPRDVTAIRTAQALGEEVAEAQLVAIDRYVAELALKDEDPAAVGEISVDDDGALVAGGYGSVRQTYTVGSRGMSAGGKLVLGMQLLTTVIGRLQVSDETADNYVSVQASDPAARFEATEVLMPGIHGAWRGSTPSPALVLQGTALAPGSTVTVTFGDRAGGSQGLRVQHFATDELLFPLYVDLDGSGVLLTPRWPGVEVAGGEVSRVAVFAPSVVAPGEPFVLGVRAEDHFANRASPPLPAWNVLLDGEPTTRVEGGGEAIVRLEGQRLEEPGVHVFEVISEDGSIRARSNPVWVREEGTPRLLWGETHVHSGYAEGQGSAEEVFRYAREDARIDFLGYSEHDIMMDDGEWRTLQDLARRNTVPGTFAAFVGYEWTVRRGLGGHHNVFFRTPDHDRVPAQEAPTLPDLYRGLRAAAAADDTLVIPHAHQAADWTQSDPELERLVEIYSMHGTFQWFGDIYLRNGWKVGFIGASDDHRAKPGYAPGLQAPTPLQQRAGLAAVWSEESTPDAIFDALRSLRAYATSGERMILEATLNDSPMGTRHPATSERRLQVRAAGTAPIERIDVIKNGAVVFSRDYLTAPLEPECVVQVGFESSSAVYDPERDNPRPYRTWQGDLEVKGARLVEVVADGLDNSLTELARRDDSEAQRVRFRISTRGRRDSFLLRLAGASRSTRFTVRLEETTEQGFAPVLRRRPATIPASELELAFSDLDASRLELSLAVDVHTDLVTLQVVDPGAPAVQDLEWTDLVDSGSADYYYVRVTQLDGGRAWSSPFWVGGEQE